MIGYIITTTLLSFFIGAAFMHYGWKRHIENGFLEYDGKLYKITRTQKP